jgi:hypothetical protein
VTLRTGGESVSVAIPRAPSAVPEEPEDDESDEEVVSSQVTGGPSIAAPEEPEEEMGQEAAPKEVTLRTGSFSLSVPVPSAPLATPEEPEDESDEEAVPEQSTVAVVSPEREEDAPQWTGLSREGRLPAYQILLGLSAVAARISAAPAPAAAVPKAADFDTEFYRWDPKGFAPPGAPGSGDTESKRRSRLKKRRAPLVTAAGKLAFAPLDFSRQARPPAGRVVVALTDRFDIPQPTDAGPWRKINWRGPAAVRNIENVEFVTKQGDREKGPIDHLGEAVIVSAAVESEVDGFYGQKYVIAVKAARIPELGLMTHPKLDRPKRQKREIAVIRAPTTW